MDAEVISIGSELMAGCIADTNAAFLSERLTRMGFSVRRHTAVGDERDKIAAAFRETATRSDVAVITGGLGPTPDDVTRQVLAESCDAELVEDAEMIQRIRQIFAARRIAPPASNFIQACIPRGGDVIRNPSGTAAGFAITYGSCRFYCLPGVPAEMKAMFEQTVEPELRRTSGCAAVTGRVHVFGMSESLIGERLKDLMGEGKDPEVATQAQDGVITIRITSQGQEERATRERVEGVRRVIRAQLGDAIIGEEDRGLAETVADLLESRNATLAVAESCTGGQIAARITDIPGVSRFFLEGAVTYSNEAKIQRLGVPTSLIEQHGAVSREVAEAMARGMRAASGADIALGITGTAGPGGATPSKPVGLVYVALAAADKSRCEELRLAGDRTRVRNRATKHALNMLRLHLQGREKTDG